ncbi:ribbon-helix-helix domain-containing protein [Pseudomonas zanjanensis]|uniref:ribbon-helix-helix domain-containing protein n=1 Tax=Pseudomonas zanjanensis TaxID=2745496 RepID=UPI001CED306E|nr:type II toxin-antitoxin system ParD family antitoxin [Pseudomonas zanjanensis]
MITLTITLPDALKSFIDDQVSQRGYSTHNEYVRELIRKDQNRQRLRGLVLAGTESALTFPVKGDYFESLRAKVGEDEAREPPEPSSAEPVAACRS